MLPLEAPHWAPNRSTLLLLKQLGYPQDVIDTRLEEYRQAGGHPSDERFKVFVVQLQQEATGHQLESRPLPTVWHPSVAEQAELRKLGYTDEAIEHYRQSFLIWLRENSIEARFPDALFRKYCAKLPTAIPQPLPREWLPSVAVLKAISERLQVDVDQVIDLVAGFVNSRHYQLSDDWDGTFSQWVERRLKGSR